MLYHIGWYGFSGLVVFWIGFHGHIKPQRMMFQQSGVDTMVWKLELYINDSSYLLEELYSWAEKDGSTLSDDIQFLYDSAPFYLVKNTNLKTKLVSYMKKNNDLVCCNKNVFKTEVYGIPTKFYEDQGLPYAHSGVQVNSTNLDKLICPLV